MFRKKNEMVPQSQLTERQKELLEHIRSQVASYGRMPSFREMAKALDVKAVGTIQDHVKALIQKGHLTYEQEHLCLVELPRVDNFMEVPIIGEVAAGSLQEAIELNLGTLPFWASKPSKSLFALKVHGESMIEAGIFPKDTIVADSKLGVKSGDIAVVSVSGEATVKEIHWPKKKSDPVCLRPRNSSMKDILVEPTSEFRVLGKVVALHRDYS